MTSLELTPVLENRSVRRRRFRAILFPVEHGGWGLTLEPVVAGLLVAFSAPGLAIGIAILTAFIARQPSRIVIRPGSQPERLRIAVAVLTIEAILIGVLVLFSLSQGALRAVVLLAVASPLALFLLLRDRARRSRDLVAEISAALFMSCGAGAVVLAGGGTPGIALALGLLISARSVGAILYVRERVSVRRARPVSRSIPIAFHAAALGAAIAMVLSGVSSPLAPLAFVVLLGRTIFPISPESPARLGWAEMCVGLISVVLISFSLA